jgi:hypothetical protein
MSLLDRTQPGPGRSVSLGDASSAPHRGPGVTRDIRATIRDMAANAPVVRLSSLAHQLDGLRLNPRTMRVP